MSPTQKSNNGGNLITFLWKYMRRTSGFRLKLDNT